MQRAVAILLAILVSLSPVAVEAAHSQAANEVNIFVVHMGMQPSSMTIKLSEVGQAWSVTYRHRQTVDRIRRWHWPWQSEVTSETLVSDRNFVLPEREANALTRLLSDDQLYEQPESRSRCHDVGGNVDISFNGKRRVDSYCQLKGFVRAVQELVAKSP